MTDDTRNAIRLLMDQGFTVLRPVKAWELVENPPEVFIRLADRDERGDEFFVQPENRLWCAETEWRSDPVYLRIRDGR